MTDLMDLALARVTGGYNDRACKRDTAYAISVATALGSTRGKTPLGMIAKGIASGVAAGYVTNAADPNCH